MFIPGMYVSMITFPGVVVHELAHQLFCRWLKVPVFKVVYYQFDNPAGYVLHERPKQQWKSLFISIGPFFINTLLGILIALPAALPIASFSNPGFIDIVLLYLGVSIAMHAFPSRGDAEVIWSSIREEGTPMWLKILAYPVVGLIHLVAIGSFFWLDAIYGVAVTIGFPKLLVALCS
ncbi:DUF3267 domain-containing protein [Deminuibacter soli]|uniref:DUF3267 domain-containing protein n=1 Tax=Deminuibacter soli TaxID=2291815 RepID=A0A3E1NL53_9BACT|nr:DUF3267 domain-containing protein [Deminuibacter soli]RFM28574.1 DUF3267 domain-containing protein [Deminuibacter soli]